MAELSAFSFRSGTSLLHRLDVRFKLLFLISISLLSLGGGFLRLSVFTGLLTVLLANCRLPLKSGLKELRFFLFLLVLIIAARMVATPGTPIIEIKSFSITREGLLSGVLICWRLSIIIWMGLAFVYSTRSSEIKAAVQWVLKPFAFVPRKRIATMMSLITRLVPVIFNQASETAEAQRARCVENRKNPIYRLIKLGTPLIRRTFERADKLVLAMQARCYTENRSDPRLSATRIDWIALAIMLLVWALVVRI